MVWRHAASGTPLLLLSACALSIPIRPPLEPSRWQVIAINGQPTPASDNYVVQFGNGRFGGRIGCNHFGGPYRVSGGVMVVGEIAATRMACAGLAMTHERTGLAALRSPLQMGWTHSGSRLTLVGASGSITLSKMRRS